MNVLCGLTRQNKILCLVVYNICRTKTLQSGFLDKVEDLLVDGHVQDIKETRKEIHTRAVEAAISSGEPNRVLRTASPEIQEEEMGMTRGERTALAQLRSGYSSDLESFKNSIGISDS